jgi:hypothetical protein
MREAGRFPSMFLAASLLATGLASASAGNFDLSVSTAVGYDSNPLELPRQEESGLFTELSLDTGFGTNGRPVGFFIRASGAQRWYAGDLSPGNSRWADLRAGLTVATGGAGDPLSLSLGGSYGLVRSTFVDPATGGVFRFGGDPIPARYDFDRASAFLDVHWRVHRWALLYVTSELERRQFIKDYTETGLHPLDDRTLSMEPGVRFRAGPYTVVDLSVAWGERVYDHLPALDRDGFEIADSTRTYRFTELRLATYWNGLGAWSLGAGLLGSQRNDSGAGYYDYRGRGAFVSLGRPLGSKMQMRMSSTLRDLSYANATIDNDPSSLRRSSELFQLLGELERSLTRRSSVFVGAGLNRSDNPDPFYAFDRRWARTGFRFQL